MTLSINTLMLAIKAVERDMERLEDVLDDEFSAEETLALGTQTQELAQALGELGRLYERERQQHPQCPPLEQLLG
jgi:hypothetical protein